jgi:hypothetical protein
VEVVRLASGLALRNASMTFDVRREQNTIEITINKHVLATHLSLVFPDMGFCSDYVKLLS